MIYFCGIWARCISDRLRSAVSTLAAHAACATRGRWFDNLHRTTVARVGASARRVTRRGQRSMRDATAIHGASAWRGAWTMEWGHTHKTHAPPLASIMRYLTRHGGRRGGLQLHTTRATHRMHGRGTRLEHARVKGEPRATRLWRVGALLREECPRWTQKEDNHNVPQPEPESAVRRAPPAPWLHSSVT